MTYRFNSGKNFSNNQPVNYDFHKISDHKNNFPSKFNRKLKIEFIAEPPQDDDGDNNLDLFCDSPESDSDSSSVDVEVEQVDQPEYIDPLKRKVYRDPYKNEVYVCNKYLQNPFFELFKIEQCFIDNAPDEIKELIDDLEDIHTDYWTIDKLDALSQQMKHLDLAYVRTGMLAFVAKTKKIYLEKYRSYDQWCRIEHGLSASTMDDKIRASIVALRLIGFGYTKLPKNISQAVVLYELDDNRLGEIWCEVLHRFDLSRVTARKINLVINPPNPKDEIKCNTLDVSNEVHDQVIENSWKRKETINDYLKTTVSFFETHHGKISRTFDLAVLLIAQHLLSNLSG